MDNPMLSLSAPDPYSLDAGKIVMNYITFKVAPFMGGPGCIIKVSSATDNCEVDLLINKDEAALIGKFLIALSESNYGK